MTSITCPTCTFVNAAVMTNCEMCTSPLHQPTNGPTDGQWDCNNCTFSNASAMPVCETCHTPRNAPATHRTAEQEYKDEKEFKVAADTLEVELAKCALDDTTRRKNVRADHIQRVEEHKAYMRKRGQDITNEHQRNLRDMDIEYKAKVDSIIVKHAKAAAPKAAAPKAPKDPKDDTQRLHITDTKTADYKIIDVVCPTCGHLAAIGVDAVVNVGHYEEFVNNRVVSREHTVLKLIGPGSVEKFHNGTPFEELHWFDHSFQCINCNNNCIVTSDFRVIHYK